MTHSVHDDDYWQSVGSSWIQEFIQKWWTSRTEKLYRTVSNCVQVLKTETYIHFPEEVRRRDGRTTEIQNTINNIGINQNELLLVSRRTMKYWHTACCCEQNYDCSWWMSSAAMVSSDGDSFGIVMLYLGLHV